MRTPEPRRRSPGPGHAARRAAAALALFATATLQAPSTGATGGTFRGVAAAEGVRVGVTAAGAPVTNNVVDGASPIAQAAVDSTSGSSALASVAYPGDLVVTTPGLLAGVSGGQLSGVPPYPLIATAGSTTTPEQKVEGPGSAMRATAVDRRAEATARSGAAPAAEGTPAPAWATSSTVEADDVGAVTATATSEVTGVSIGPLVLGRVTTRSIVRRAPGADPVRETSFAATGLSIGETAVTLTPAGLVVAGTTTPVSATPLQPVLDGAGVSVRWLAAENTAEGVVSAGLVVTRTQPLPGAISPVTVSSTFGRALAAVSAAALAPISSDVAVPPLPAASGADGTGSGVSTGPAGAGAAIDGGGAGGVGGGRGAGSGLSVGGIPRPATGSGGGSGADGAAANGGTTGAAEATEAAGGPAPVVGAAVPVRRVGSRLFDLGRVPPVRPVDHLSAAGGGGCDGWRGHPVHATRGGAAVDLKTWLKAQWDRVLGAGAVLTGAVTILLGYRGVADTPFPAEQIPYVISGAVVGIALIGIGLTSWLSADLRDEWRKLDRIEHLLEPAEVPAVTEPAP